MALLLFVTLESKDPLVITGGLESRHVWAETRDGNGEGPPACVRCKCTFTCKVDLERRAKEYLSGEQEYRCEVGGWS